MVGIDCRKMFKIIVAGDTVTYGCNNVNFAVEGPLLICILDVNSTILWDGWTHRYPQCDAL